MDIRLIFERIEAMAPPAAAMGWDKCGVQVASSHTDVAKLAVALDPVPESIAAALDWGAGCILTHHPLSMKPRFPDQDDAYLGVLRSVICASAWLYAAHTSLDANPQGPAGWLARELRLQNLQIMEITLETDDVDYGVGFAGDLAAPVSWETFNAMLAKATGLPAWRESGPRPETISRAAYCTGSGSSLAQTAKDAGADIFVTGDMKYHPAQEAPLCVADVGHFSLEEEMMRRCARQLADDPALSSIDIRFFPGQDPFRPVVPAQDSA